MARAFSLAGADVMIASRSLDSCRATADAISAESGRAVKVHACHVGRWNEVDELAEVAWNELGGVDVLVNNAGKSPLYESVAAIDEKLWDSVIGLNLKGPFRLSALLGTRMANVPGPPASLGRSSTSRASQQYIPLRTSFLTPPPRLPSTP